MAHYSIALLPGDGIGVEIAVQARRVLDRITQLTDLASRSTRFPVVVNTFWSMVSIGPMMPMPDVAKPTSFFWGLLDGVPDGKGPVTMPNGKMAGYSPVIGNRVNLDLYANIRPVKLFDGVKARISGERKAVWDSKNVDMVFLRENTEGLYSGIGGVVGTGGVGQVASDTRIITRKSSERIIRLAFEMAMQRNGAPKDGKKRVTCIVKNNILHGCRFFAEIFEDGKRISRSRTRRCYRGRVHAVAHRSTRDYDVLVTTNMFGDIVTDLASVLQGGMGMAVAMSATIMRCSNPFMARHLVLQAKTRSILWPCFSRQPKPFVG